MEWPELYRRAERLRTAGVPATDRRVRDLVARMDELGVLFSGGDAGVSAGVRTAWRTEAAVAEPDSGPQPNPEARAGAWMEPGSEAAGEADVYVALADYLDAAREARAAGPRPTGAGS
ncbi:hypothetical protein [Streptomyces sp. Ac-502]|uniref:hypothetical protein n=1 Tax=Streptomyces sp. Ac-502 TaxID=3342801 RepID=UPI0038628EBB